MDDGAAGEWEAGEPIFDGEGFLDGHETSTTAAEEDFAGELFFGVEFVEGEIETGHPRVEGFVDGFVDFFSQACFDFGAFEVNFELFGVGGIATEGNGNLTREATTADGEGLGAFYATVVYYGYVCCASADVY